jgi:hypothetical protein
MKSAGDRSKNKGRPGRPCSPEADLHSKYVHVLLTPEQKKKLVGEAKRRNLTLSGYIRLRSLDLPVIEPIGEVHQKIAVQMGEISQLLDQCLSEGLLVDRQVTRTVDALCKELDDQLFNRRRRQK